MTIDKLLEVDTRYNHYQELKDIWQSGIEIIDNMAPNWKGEKEAKVRELLVSAVGLVNKEIERLAQFGEKQWDLRRTVDSIPAIQKLLGDGQ